MDASENFQRCLDIGKDLEDACCRKFCLPLDPKSKVVGKEVPEYDIIIPKFDWKIEVKSDQKARYSDNVFFEISGFEDRPSGISITTADSWFHYTWFKLYSIRVPHLKEWLVLLKDFIRTGCGDKGYSTGYVIPVSEFETQAKVLWER